MSVVTRLPFHRKAFAILFFVAALYSPTHMRHAELFASYGPTVRNALRPAGDPDPSIPDYVAEVTLRGVPGAGRVPVGVGHYVSGDGDLVGTDLMAAFMVPDGSLVETFSYGSPPNIQEQTAWQGVFRFVLGVPRAIPGTGRSERITLDPVFVNLPVEFVRGQNTVYDYTPTGFVRAGTAPLQPRMFYEEAWMNAILAERRRYRLAVGSAAVGVAVFGGVLASIAAFARRRPPHD